MPSNKTFTSDAKVVSICLFVEKVKNKHRSQDVGRKKSLIICVFIDSKKAKRPKRIQLMIE